MSIPDSSGFIFTQWLGITVEDLIGLEDEVQEIEEPEAPVNVTYQVNELRLSVPSKLELYWRVLLSGGPALSEDNPVSQNIGLA